MTKTQVEQEKDLAAEKLEAEVREADSRLQVLRAEAEARQAKAEMDEISGLSAAKERVKQDIANLKRRAASDFAAAKSAVEQRIAELKAGIQRLSERLEAWDAARGRRFDARLDEAEAKLQVWKAGADQKRAQIGMKHHDNLATLEERIALGRARAADARFEKYSAKAQAALEDAARRFDEAYEAAAGRYGQ